MVITPGEVAAGEHPAPSTKKKITTCHFSFHFSHLEIWKSDFVVGCWLGIRFFSLGGPDPSIGSPRWMGRNWSGRLLLQCQSPVCCGKSVFWTSETSPSSGPKVFGPKWEGAKEELFLLCLVGKIRSNYGEVEWNHAKCKHRKGISCLSRSLAIKVGAS